MKLWPQRQRKTLTQSGAWLRDSGCLPQTGIQQPDSPKQWGAIVPLAEGSAP
jgi:hypothetical protein